MIELFWPTRWVIVFFVLFFPLSGSAFENNTHYPSTFSAKDKIKDAKKIEDTDSYKAIDLVDEAILSIDTKQDKTTLFDAYLTKAKLLVKIGNFEDALLAANQALMVALETGRESQASQAYELVSKIYLSSELKSESLEYLYKGLEVYKQLKDSAQIIWYLINIPQVEYDLGRLANAIEISLKSVDLFQKKGDSINLIKAFHLLGLINTDLNNFNTSKEYLEKSLSLSEKLKDSLQIGINYNSLARLNFQIGNIDESEKYTLNASKILTKFDNKIFYRNQVLLGKIFSKKNNYPAALQLYKEALIEQEELDDYSGVANTLLEIGNLYFNKSDYKNAIQSYNRCLLISKEKGFLKLSADSYKGLANSYGKLGSIDQAYSYLNHYIRITDSLFYVQKSNEAYKLASQVEVRQKENEIIFQKAKLSHNNDQIKQSNQKQILLYVVIFLALSSVVFAYREFKLKKRANIELSIQKKEIEEQSLVVQKRNRDITDSLNYARRIQQAILRTSSRLDELFTESFILFIPKDIVSGDFYWVKSKGDIILFAIADCTGHGAPGAFMSIIGTYGLNGQVSEQNQTYPGEILNNINVLFQNSFSQREGSEIFDGMDIALCSYNKITKELIYSGANLPLHILRENSKPQPTSQIVHNNNTHTLYQVKPNKQPIGYVFEETSYKTHSIQLLEGDIIYLFTDGFADQFGGLYRKKFRYQELRKLICDIATLPLKDQQSTLVYTFRRWKGDNIQIDDVSFMGIKIS
ncbi:MAG: SpoIIE family protein phosphatase [Tenuifilaceae bacterium]